MLKNYLKISWRNLVKNKAHTFINIAGLSLGMAVVMLISLWIYDELSYDKYFKNYDRIVQVMQHQTVNGDVNTGTSIPIPLGAKLRQDYKGDFKYAVLSSWTEPHILSHGDKKLVKDGNFMQPEAPYIFTLNMLRGSRSGLNDPSSILLSSTLAKAIFGDADPMNQIIKIDNQLTVKVTGVYETPPYNTSFSYIHFILPWDLYLTTRPFLKRVQNNWGNNSWQIFALLAPNADINNVDAKIKYIKRDNLKLQGDAFTLSYKPVLFLHPLSKWHLYSDFKNGINTGGKIEFVWMFGIIGLFVLILACINFMNLSTARSEKRAKEVGIRKTLGSMRNQLVGQFFTESLLMAFFAFLFSLMLVQLTLPWFNQVADKRMTLLWSNPWFWLIGIGFTLLTGLLAGSYPAFYLSSFKPVKVLKGTFKAGRFAAVPRKVLVVLQFTVSVTLIIGTIIVFRQVQFTKNRPVGYDRAGLIQAQMKTNDIHSHFDAVKNDLFKSGAIAGIAESDSPLTGVWSNESGFSWRGKPPGLLDDFGIIPVSYDFGKTAEWQLMEGRDFSRSFATDTSTIIVNEAAAKFMNFKHPVGEVIKWEGQNVTIIGEIKDMVMSSPYEPVKPSIFALLPYKGSFINIRLNPKIGTSAALGKIEAVFKQYAPDSPFDYKFTDTEYASKFEDEERIGRLSGFFTVLAIFISCLGLFGMASFMAEQRTKEIGVRKVLGASVMNLWGLMSREFVVLVVISIIIASPVAYYFMQNWIKNYKYHADISWWIFAGTAAGAMLITLLTVSYQGIKSALMNPIKSLRSE
ncbi:ABC transporter permease [Mucilaginibacter sp. X5P1]|uniref:ABC transporter permease n=1 Tax=Mucilaginibacter sp. X5P1 TaxID=2723088 RepID=UPI001622A8C3|nr:ABC transporter permease [Mucilaginibacter sp. X5P1]MBB6138457.1 ABC-type antimicrobial peptide transport system permease subunit [Mucilaginibacter sp. X5P1]